MKRICLALLPSLMILISISANSQTADEMKKWMDYMTPSDVHKMIAKSNGEWKEDITMWMDPKAPPQKMEGSCTNTMILGDRYQECVQHGSFNGMPFEGKSLLAYDNIRKVFITTWIDNMGTGIIVMEGTWDDKTKTITFVGKETDPFTGKDRPIKQTFTMVDDNTQHMMMFATNEAGTEYKSMDMMLTRKK
jgi:hypothetical protein